MYAAVGITAEQESARAIAASAGAERGRQARYDRMRLEQIFIDDTGEPPTSGQLDAIPTCISEARKEQATAACQAPGGDYALGPQSDPMVQAGISECGIARMRVCLQGEEAQIAKAGASAAPGSKMLLYGVGALVVGGLVYVLVRK